jgi:hypothetical protein
MSIASRNGAADVTALSGLVPVELLTVWSAWAVHFLVLTVILFWVEVPVLGRARVVSIGLPFAVRVNTSRVLVVLVLGLIIKVLPEVTNSSMDGVPVGVEVHVALCVTFVVFLDSTFTLSFVVTRVTFAPRVVVAVTFDPAVIWVTLFFGLFRGGGGVFFTAAWRCLGWVWVAWVSHTTSFMSP